MDLYNKKDDYFNNEVEDNSSKRKYSVDEGVYYNKRIRGSDSIRRLSEVSNISSMDETASSADDSSVVESSFANEDASYISTDEEAVNTNFSSNAQKMMEIMGYKEGKGLGKFQQGMVAPIEASRQRGRRGLGFSIKGFEPMENLTWDKSKEYIVVEEEVCWLPSNSEEPPNFNLLNTWIKEDVKKEEIKGETEFCRPDILESVLESKSVFDHLSEKEMYKARTRCNPFETIGKLFFQNRAALKMANLDAVFDFMFTQPVDENGHSLVKKDELLYFADVCAAPGGFSEYVLWKRKIISNGFCDAKGFGFTLKENDFKLHDFYAAPAEFFEPHYGVSGLIGSGDIYVPENITNFRNFVLKSTGNMGVHFMMADGGFSVEGQENIQEILSKQLYLCQFLVALGILRIDGHFVCKLFDVFTPFSVGLIYIMYKCFRHVALHKPNSSRPANSERYIVCKWRKENIDDCYQYLFKVNQLLKNLSPENRDISEIVPLQVLKDDEEFYQYIYESNNLFGQRQVVSLNKIQAFCQDLSLIEDQQVNLRSECLKFWQLPDQPRVAPVRMSPKEKSLELINREDLAKFASSPEELSLDNYKSSLHSPYDFRFVLLSSAKDSTRDRGFFLGLGGSNVFQWNGKESLWWNRCTYRIELPPDTLVYGEIVVEHRGELKAQRRVNSFHMIDALVLNGFDVTNRHIGERHTFLIKFASALNKEGRNDLVPIRCKQLYRLDNIKAIMQPPILSRKQMKGSAAIRRVYYEGEDRYSIPTGVFLLKVPKEPYMLAYSKSHNTKYWFNTLTGSSTFETQQQCIAPVSESYSKGMIWWWDYGLKVLDSDEEQTDKLHFENILLHFDNLANHIKTT